MFCLLCVGYLLAARFFMCIALVGGVAAWILSIVGLLQHRARWLLIAAICYGVQGTLLQSMRCALYTGILSLCCYVEREREREVVAMVYVRIHTKVQQHDGFGHYLLLGPV